MTVAIAHQASSSSRTIALHEAARQAQFRRTDLAVIHVVESLDLDVEAAYRSGLDSEIKAALAGVGASEVSWDLHLATTQEDVAETILEATTKVGADLLVIGARRRSPLGKFVLGSVTQTLILDADVPILVVKSPVGGEGT
jgi:nucleotide-binding universal stress UspA family protein